jgi:glucokinase
MGANPQTILVADIGGTNARFALGRRQGDGSLRLSAPRAFPNDMFDGPDDAVRAYLADAPAPPQAAVFALAGPVRNGAARLTNRDWAFSTESVRAASGAGAARLLNDFAAAALSLPFLPDAALLPLGGPTHSKEMWARMWASPDLRVSVIGPGTGLGHALLVRLGGEMRALDTEGGHIGFAAWDEKTWAVQRAIAARFGRCSLEHLLSGAGLANLYAALSGEDEPPPATEIAPRADSGDAVAAETLTMFCDVLGAAAGDLALATGARCIFIMGGVAQALAERLCTGGFRDQFEAKGQFTDYMRAIPTVLARDRHAGLIGAAAAICPDASSIVVEED